MKGISGHNITAYSIKTVLDTFSFAVDEWRVFEKALNEKFPDDGFLERISLLGRLFTDFPRTDRASKQFECTLWLVRNHPMAACHQEPSVYDVADDYFDTVATAWDEAVQNYPLSPSVCQNAGIYFYRRDRWRSERAFEAGARLEPNNLRWQRQLNKLKAFHAG